MNKWTTQQLIEHLRAIQIVSDQAQALGVKVDLPWYKSFAKRSGWSAVAVEKRIEELAREGRVHRAVHPNRGGYLWKVIDTPENAPDVEGRREEWISEIKRGKRFGVAAHTVFHRYGNPLGSDLADMLSWYGMTSHQYWHGFEQVTVESMCEHIRRDCD